MHAPRAEEQRPVAADRPAAAQHPEVRMRFDTREIAAHADRPSQRAVQWETREPAGQSVEREGVGADVRKDAQDVAPEVETDGAVDEADGTVAVVMAQRAAEHRVLERAGECTRRIELALEIESRHEAPHGADVDASRCHLEGLKSQVVAGDVDFAFAEHLRLRPTGHE